MEADFTAIALVVAAACCTVVLWIVAAAEAALERSDSMRLQTLAARGESRRLHLDGEHSFHGPLVTTRVLFGGFIIAAAAFAGARALEPFPGALGTGMAGIAFVAALHMTAERMAATWPEQTVLRLGPSARVAEAAMYLPSLVFGLPWRVLQRPLQRFVRAGGADESRPLEPAAELVNVEEQEERMIRGVFALEERTAREIMVPRIDIVALSADDTAADLAAIVNERGFSRVPVYRESIDDVVGLAYAKDLLRGNAWKDRRLDSMLHDAIFVPDSKRLDSLLVEMRASRTHMAIVVDEYGGTAGLVTFEDLLEEIVGEIEDEFDLAGPKLEKISEDEVVLDAGASTRVLEEIFGYEVDSEDFDTVGGFLIHALGRLPVVGDEVEAGGMTLRVLSMAGRRLRRLRVSRTAREGERTGHAAVG